jgi:hypothetical protein
MRSSRTLRVFHLFVLALLGVCCCGCKRTSLTINADKSYGGRTLDLRIGDGVTLSLAENPTTGYRWELVAKPEPNCVVVNDTYVANADAIGSGGISRRQPGNRYGQPGLPAALGKRRGPGADVQNDACSEIRKAKPKSTLAPRMSDFFFHNIRRPIGAAQ